MLTLIFTLLSASLASAADAPPVLDVSVKLEHSRQWTRVFNSQADGWFCATENNPRYPLTGKPAFLDLVRDKADAKASCRETFTARLSEGETKRTWTACRNTAEAKKFLKALGRDCGRF